MPSGAVIFKMSSLGSGDVFSKPLHASLSFEENYLVYLSIASFFMFTLFRNNVGCSGRENKTNTCTDLRTRTEYILLDFVLCVLLGERHGAFGYNLFPGAR